MWLYDAQKVSAFDQSTFDYVYARFAEDFGGVRPWIVREWQWFTAKNAGSDTVLRTEGLYNWGAAPFGFNPDTRFTVAEVGPGFTSFDTDSKLRRDSSSVQVLPSASGCRRKELLAALWQATHRAWPGRFQGPGKVRTVCSNRKGNEHS